MKLDQIRDDRLTTLREMVGYRQSASPEASATRTTSGQEIRERRAVLASALERDGCLNVEMSAHFAERSSFGSCGS